jgi:hypothetical protein
MTNANIPTIGDPILTLMLDEVKKVFVEKVGVKFDEKQAWGTLNLDHRGLYGHHASEEPTRCFIAQKVEIKVGGGNSGRNIAARLIGIPFKKDGTEGKPAILLDFIIQNNW